MVGSLFKREQIRGPGVCFGIGEERPFYVEKTPSLLVERLRHNMTFFYLNYTILTGVLFCLTLLVSPSAIIGIGILAALWFWLIKASQDGALRVGCKFHEHFIHILRISSTCYAFGKTSCQRRTDIHNLTHTTLRI